MHGHMNVKTNQTLYYKCRWENMYIQIYRQYSKLIEEQQVNEPNPLLEYAQPPHTLRESIQQDRQQRGTHDNNTVRRYGHIPK